MRSRSKIRKTDDHVAKMLACASVVAKAVDAPSFQLTEPLDVRKSEELTEALAGLASDTATIVTAVDCLTARAALQKAGAQVFRIASHPDRIFATKRFSASGEGVEIVAPVPDLSESTQAAFARSIRVLKEDSAPVVEERFVLGVVLEPDVIDSQNDTYDAPTIRAAAHKFMEDFRNLGLQHQELVNDKVQILESYVAPADFAIGETVVKAGTWLMGVRVKDDEMWQVVKSGGITGFSIGGDAFRTPEPNTEDLAVA